MPKATLPLLSICLITYNHIKYIEQSIESILEQQTKFRWQLIIADDCSTDGTREIIKAYANDYPDKIKLILQTKNLGPEQNWLSLMDYPKTKYVLYAEADDYFINTHKLQEQVDFLENHADYAMCFHPVDVIYETGSHKKEFFPTPEFRFNKTELELSDLLSRNFMQTNSVMYRWRFIKSNFSTNYPTGIMPGDWYLHILHAQTGKIGFINSSMAAYRRHESGLWWDAEANQQAFWIKNGRGHLKFFIHLQNMFKHDQELLKVVEADSINIIGNMYKADPSGQALRTVFEAYPEVAYKYVRYIKILLEQEQYAHQQVNKSLALLSKQTDELRTDLQLVRASKSYKLGVGLLRPVRAVRRSVYQLHRLK